MISRSKEIIALLGGINDDEAQAAVELIDENILYWQAAIEHPDMSDKKRAKFLKFILQLQQRRRLWAELAAIESDRLDKIEMNKTSKGDH